MRNGGKVVGGTFHAERIASAKALRRGERCCDPETAREREERETRS